MCQCEKTYAIRSLWQYMILRQRKTTNRPSVCVCVCGKEAKPPDPHLMELDNQHPF